MNPNIRFQRKLQEVSVFKIEGEIHPSIEVIDQVVGEKNIYYCKVGDQSIEVCEGDFIVIGKKSSYFNGECKLVESVEVMTASMLSELVECWDEFTEEYVSVQEAFEPIVEDEVEPSDAELKKIERELDTILFPEEEF